MIEQLFQTPRAPFITLRDGQLHVGPQAYGEMTVRIVEVQPVRKLFTGRRLECFSLDCRTGKAGRLCELCAERRRCHQRLQLRLLYHDQDQDHPAILDLPRHSFQALDQCLAQIGGLERLPTVLLLLKPVATETGWTTLQFHLLF